MKIVGLSIAPGTVSATVVQRQFKKTELLDAFTAAYGSDAELAEILRDKARAWAGSRIISVIPGRLFSQRTVVFPFHDRKKIEKALPFEVEDGLPFEMEDLVLDHLALQTGDSKGAATTVLCLILQKTVLRRHLELLAACGIDPHAVVPSFAGLAALARMLPADTGSLVLSGGDICYRSGGIVRALRSLGATASGGLRQVVQALATEYQEPIEKALVLGASPAAPPELLAELGIAAEQAAPELGGRKAADPESLGAALIDEINFRKGEFAHRRVDEGARRRRRSVIIAAAFAAALLCVNIGVKFSVVRSGYGRLDREIREIFRQTFPDARSSGDPVRQMRDKVAEARKRIGQLGSSTSVLDIMKTVTDGIPREIRVAFQEFNLDGDRLRLQGEAPSFEALDKIKAELQKSQLFDDVAVQDTRMGVGNKVKFRMDLKVKQAK